jgi:predicted RNA-binding protein with TRAM domain
VVPHYEVNVTINGSPAGSFITDISEYTVDASEGDMVSITVKTVNPDYNTNKSSSTSPSSQTIALLNAGDDDDGDGMSNGDEDNFGTDPLDKGSKFKFNSVAFEGENDFTFTWDAVPGRSYSIQASETMEPGSWTTIATGLTSGTFTDIAPSTAKRFYRIIATKL